MQEALDNVHQQFIQAVADGRKLERSRVAEIADGRILTGEQAKNLGLVDQLGNLQDTIDITAKLAGIQGKPNVLYPPKKRFSIWELLMRDMASAIVDALTEKGYELSFPIQIK